MRSRWLYLLIGLVLLGGALGGVLWWRLGAGSLPAPSPRYNVVVERPLQVEGVSAKAVLVVIHLLSGVEGLAAARHYLSRAPEADLYQLLTGEDKLLALNSRAFKGPDQLPPALRNRLVPWKAAKRLAREGPYTIYRLE
jgi:hypothetical protein